MPFFMFIMEYDLDHVLRFITHVDEMSRNKNLNSSISYSVYSKTEEPTAMLFRLDANHTIKFTYNATAVGLITLINHFSSILFLCK